MARYHAFALLILLESRGLVSSYVQPSIQTNGFIGNKLNCKTEHIVSINTSKVKPILGQSSNNLELRATLFPRTPKQRSVALFGSDVSSDEEELKKPIIQRLLLGIILKLKALFKHILKILFVIPFTKLKAIFGVDTKTQEDNETTVEKEDEEKHEKVEEMSEQKRLTKVDVEWAKETLSRIEREEKEIISENKKSRVDYKSVAPPVEDETEEECPFYFTDCLDEDDKTPDEVNAKDATVEAQDVEEKPVVFDSDVDENIEEIREEAVDVSENEDSGVEVAVIAEEDKIISEAVDEETLEAQEGSATEEIAVSEDVHEETIVADTVEVQPTLPRGERWAVAAPGTDLTGKWKIVVTDDFKKEYDQYLKNLGQPSLVRSVAVSIVEMTSEEVIQSDNGRSLCIKGRNLRGVWDRTLLSSGSDFDFEHKDDHEHIRVSLVTADKENVEAESWWEKNGTLHRSWLRGVKKYGGGDFESRRYLSDKGDTLICESIFHPHGREKDKAAITWTFKKES